MRRRRIRHVLGSTTFLLVAILAAAAGLAYYSYEYAQEMAQRAEEQIFDSTKDAAKRRRESIDKLIQFGDTIFFNLVDVGNLKDFTRRWKDIGHDLKPVQTVLVLDERKRIAPDGFASTRSQADANDFRRLFEERIRRDLGLDFLQDGQIKHLHKEYDGKAYLLSYTRRDVGGRTYFIVLEADLAHFLLDQLPEEFRDDEGKRLYQIVDEHDTVVFGQHFILPNYVISLSFTNLWAWRLRMAPRQVPQLIAEMSRRQITNWVFIGLSSVTLFVGLGILGLAVRTERRANALKSDFIANVSHDLKTPLSLIRMYGDLLSSGRTKNSEAARDYAGIISRESERLSHLIDNVLDFAKIERGGVAYEMKVGDLAEVVSRGLDVYRHRLEREGMRLLVTIEDGVPPVRIDENAMTLVLLNLIDNAVKYAADGKELRVTLGRDGDRVKLSVIDRGPGIDPVDRDHIFERFYRGRKDRSRPVRGSGIGLAIVKQIAEAHGGTATVLSDLSGSTFTVSLPVTSEPAEETAEAQALPS